MFSLLIITGDVNKDELGALIISPFDINSSQFNSPMSRTFPLFPNTVITSSILNGLVSDKYMPAIIFPKRFCEAKPITSADKVPIDAATAAFWLRNDNTMAATTIPPRILMRLLNELAV